MFFAHFMFLYALRYRETTIVKDSDKTRYRYLLFHLDRFATKCKYLLYYYIKVLRIDSVHRTSPAGASSQKQHTDTRQNR